jgi:hypothetical protein
MRLGSDCTVNDATGDAAAGKFNRHRQSDRSGADNEHVGFRVFHIVVHDKVTPQWGWRSQNQRALFSNVLPKDNFCNGKNLNVHWLKEGRKPPDVHLTPLEF